MEIDTTYPWLSDTTGGFAQDRARITLISRLAESCSAAINDSCTLYGAPRCEIDADPMASTALELGHHDSRVTFAHYRELVRPKEAARYWQIKHAKGRKIGQIVEAR